MNPEIVNQIAQMISNIKAQNDKVKKQIELNDQLKLKLQLTKVVTNNLKKK